LIYIALAMAIAAPSLAQTQSPFESAPGPEAPKPRPHPPARAAPTAPAPSPAAIPAPAQTFYGGEDQNSNIPPQTNIRPSDHHAPTPTSIPGGRVVTTASLAGVWQSASKPVLINLLTGKSVRAIPGSVWLSGGGLGNSFEDGWQPRLAQHLAALTGGNKAAPIVFYCLSSECWLSYNATLRALRLGYTNAMWYRGGITAWGAAGLPVTTIDRDQW
jgi:PQQ-dependent catabolism-associated CXXCW motif protein